MQKRILFEKNEEAIEASPASQPVVSGGAPIRLRWPTDYRVITQGFGHNPELFAAQGLPGHEGLDIRAPLSSKVYACADGTVEQVHVDDAIYGNWIAIQHVGGYRTIYAQLAKIIVGKGQRVQTGQGIGAAGNSGNSGGGHVHLGLSQAGATANRLTHYPDDIIDPTPFLNFNEPPTPIYPWPADRCLKGAMLGENGLQASGRLGLEAVRLHSNSNLDDAAKLRVAHPSLFLLTTLEADVSRALKPTEWVASLRGTVKRHSEMGVGYFEIQTAPNLTSHGYASSWDSGREFARWWLDAYALLKDSFPLARFGFPALANGGSVTGVRSDAETFLHEADEAALAADWLGAQCYWTSQKQREEINPIAHLRNWYPNKLIFVTEFGSVNALLDVDSKRREQDLYLSELQTQPGIAAAFAAN